MRVPDRDALHLKQTKQSGWYRLSSALTTLPLRTYKWHSDVNNTPYDKLVAL